MNKNIVLMELQYGLFVIGILLIYPVLITIAFILNLIKFMQNIWKPKKITGQVAVITGSAGGLGREIAIELAKRGCHIAIVDIQDKLAVETANYINDEYDVKSKAYKVDVSDYQQLVKLKDDVANDLGDTTILINNAAILVPESTNNPTPQEIQHMINVNFTAICFTHQVFLPKMKELNRGHIVTISSCSALLTSPYFNIYAATKTAVRSLTSALRMELMAEHKNITALTVMPVFLNTNKRVEKLVRLTGIQKLLPLIEGDIVAQYVVNSMLRGGDEITIPCGFLYIYKLLELLPCSIKEISGLILSIANYIKSFKSSKIKNVCSRSDNKLKIINIFYKKK